MWIAAIGYKGKQYRLIKRTKDLDAAIKARKEAEEAVKNGDFEKWRIKENPNKEIS
ncbi:MAG: AP2 domain protein [Bacteriophage sp.]|nr:MAG: AP2 domain protein [Bacteriophage sp.]